MTDDQIVLVHLQYIRDSLDGIIARLDALNGRTRENSEAIAVLQDRAADARNSAVRWAAGVGTAMAAAATAFWQFVVNGGATK